MIPKRILLIFSLVFISNSYSDLIDITYGNYENIFQTSRISFVIFTVDWCPFSAQFLPIFKQTSQIYSAKNEESKILWGHINCDNEQELCNAQKIIKFPTTSVYYFGQKAVEYRSARSIEQILKFIEDFEDSEKLVKTIEIETFEKWKNYGSLTKGILIIWFPRSSAPYELMIRASSLIQNVVQIITPFKNNSLEYEEHSLQFSFDGIQLEQFPGNLANFNEIIEWLRLKSKLLIRELTFENAEAFVEEEKPFLLLFRNKNDSKIDVKFAEAIRNIPDDQLNRLNPLTTDGNLMIFPLMRINKTPKDMPVLIIDQFVHMYTAPFQGDEIFKAENIKQFVSDFFDETLHQRFHNAEAVKNDVQIELKKIKNIQKTESAFKNLEPAKNRYSFAKQEL